MAKEIGLLSQELRYAEKKEPQKIVEDLEITQISLAKYLRLRNKYQVLLALSLIALAAAFFLMFIPPLGMTVLIIAVVATLFFLYQYLTKYSRSVQIEPYRFVIVRKLTSLLGRDMPEQADLDMNIDFTKSIIKNKLVSHGKHPLRPGWKLKIYQDHWLCTQGTFCDRTNFDLKIIEHHRNSSGWKTSISGKRKHKSKNKFKGSEICLQLRYPAKKYGAIQVFQHDAMNAIKLPNYAEIKNFKLNSKSIFLKVNLPPQFNHQTSYYRAMSGDHKVDTTYETVTSMFLSLYQILNLAHRLSK